MLIFFFSSILFLKAQTNLQCDTPADFTYTSTGCDFFFTPASSGNDITHSWQFKTIGVGYTSFSNITNPRHTFGEGTGLRQVTHTVYISGVSYTCTKEFTVTCTENCDDKVFGYVVNGCSVSFQESLPIGTLWDFGDGTTSSQQNPTHTYALSGDYIVTLTNNGLVCRKTIRVFCGGTSPCCSADFTAEVKRECSVLRLSLKADCADSGTHQWIIVPVGNNCITLNNFFQGLPDQNQIQITNINTCLASTLDITHRIVCSDGTTHTVTKSISINDQGIFIGIDLLTTNLSEYDCVLPGSVYNGQCPVYSSGIVKINKNFTFSMAKVFVQPGLTGFDVYRPFVLQQNTTVTGNAEEQCNCLWRGISVTNNTSMTTSDASIEDALYAIRVGQSSVINIRSTTFRKNYIGIRSTEGPFTLSGFANNLFDGAGPLKNICDLNPLNDISVGILPNAVMSPVTYQNGGGFAGMYLQGAGSINLQTLLGANQNVFRGVAVGIDAYDTDLNITRNSRFENISGIPYTLEGGMAIRFIDNDVLGANSLRLIGNGATGTPNINNCTFGVFVSTFIQASPFSGTRIHITQNRMIGVQAGIQLAQNDGTITGNINNPFFKGIGNNYIEVNPLVDNSIFNYWTLTGIRVSDFGFTQSSPEIWQNRIDVNQDDECGSYGIRVNGVDFNTTETQVDINRNTINVNAGSHGIEVGNYTGAFIHDNNNQTFPGAGIFLNYERNESFCELVQSTISGNCQGIHVSAGGNHLIACNDITTASPNHTMAHLRAQENTTFVRNNMYGGKYSVRFGQGNPGTKFACNAMMDYHENGLQYYGNASTDDQGSPTVTHGNTWSTTATNTIGAFADFTVDATQSKFYVRNLSNENPVNNQMDWFIPFVPVNTTPTCYYNCPISTPQNLLDEVTKNDSTVANGLTAPVYYPEATTWMEKRYLVEKLTKHPELRSSNSLMENFMQQHQNEALGQLGTANRAVTNLFELNNADKSMLEGYTTSINNWLYQLFIQDSLLAQTTDSTLFKTIKTERDSVAALLINMQNAAGDLMRTIDQNRLQNIPGLQHSIAQIITTNVYESNEKAVLLAYLGAIAMRQRPDAATLAQMQTIGSQCSYINGPAVHNARAIFEYYTGIPMPDVDCPDFQERLERSNVSSNKLLAGISLFPNPATDELVVALPGLTSTAPTEIQFSNVLGSLVWRHVLTAGQNKLLVNDIPAGAYFVRIVQDNTVLHTTTVFIQH